MLVAGSRRCSRRPRRPRPPGARTQVFGPVVDVRCGSAGRERAGSGSAALSARRWRGSWRRRSGEESGPGGQVGGDLGEHQPGLLDRELSRWEAPEPGVFGVPDPVLDPGVGTVPGFEERQLAALGVGDECLVAPAVSFFEQRQLRAGVGPLAVDDDPHPAGPLGRDVVGDEAGQLRDVTALTDSAVGVECRCPDLLRYQVDGLAQCLGDRESHRVLHASATDVVLCGEPVQQFGEAPAPSERISSFLRWAAGIWAIASVSTSRSAAVFEPAFARAELGGEELAGVVAHTPSGWNPKVRLNVGAAFSFSEWATTIVASVSSTVTSF